MTDQDSDQRKLPSSDPGDANYSPPPLSQKQPGQDLDENRPQAEEAPADFEPGQTEERVRPAGPEDISIKPRTWSKTDQEVDESFPASDPPGNY